MIVVALIGIITGILGDLFITTWRTFNYTNEALTAEQEARIAMEKIAKDLRAASSLESVSANNVTFYRYFENDTVATRIEIYWIQNRIEYKKTTPLGSFPNITYPAENSTVLIISEHNANKGINLFDKYDENNQLDNDLAIGQVKMIGVNLIVDINTNRPPSPFTLSSTIGLRNTKTN